MNNTIISRFNEFSKNVFDGLAENFTGAKNEIKEVVSKKVENIKREINDGVNEIGDILGERIKKVPNIIKDSYNKSKNMKHEKSILGKFSLSFKK
jgi:gas vesicle protein